MAITSRRMLATIVDTETSGLIGTRLVRDQYLPEITEFFGCKVDLSTDDPPEEELHYLAKPSYGPVAEEIEKKTHITNEMLKNEKPFKEYAERTRRFLEAAEAVIAHNCAFDKEMIEIEMARANKVMAWPRLICTVEQTLHLQGKRLSLSALHEHLFGVKHKDAHRAKPDVEALVRICREMYKRGDLE